jgi:hypothetical protein
VETLIGIGLLVVLVLVYVLLGLGEGGTTCFRCDKEEPTGGCRGCPLRMLERREVGSREESGGDV